MNERLILWNCRAGASLQEALWRCVNTIGVKGVSLRVRWSCIGKVRYGDVEKAGGCICATSATH